MKAAVYVRVSSEEQVDGYSLDAQVRAAKAYCEREKWDATFFEEPGRSGTNTDKRPVFRDMIARCKAHQFDVVLVHKMDRFARSREDSIVYKSLLKREGIRVISVTEQFDDGPMGQLVEGFMECIAQWYSANLSTEVKKGQGERALAGKHHARIPLGYKLNGDGTCVPDPETAPIVRNMFTEYACGNNTLDGIRHDLAIEMGIKRSRSGVRGILTNTFYLGIVRHIDTDIKGIHEPLVDADLFSTAQEVMRKQHRGSHKAGALRCYELTGIFACSCGRLMYGQSQRHGKNFYYLHRTDLDNCDRKGTRLVKAEAAERIVNHFLCRPVAKDWQYRIANITAPKPVEPAEDKWAERLQRAKELYITGDMTRDEYVAMKKGVPRPAPKPIVSKPDLAALLSVISTPERAWIEATPLERKARNRLLLKWVTMENYEITGYELTPLGKAVFRE